MTLSCSVHVLCVWVRVITSSGRTCVRMSVFFIFKCFVRLSHHVQSCSCVYRVDVLKWGHFLSVWCLRNNPTAQKLLQPSASTYLSLYLYCGGYAFLFDSVLFMLFGNCMLQHNHIKVFNACFVAHNMRFWWFLSLATPVCTWLRYNVMDWHASKISDLGSSVCGPVLMNLFVLFFY